MSILKDLQKSFKSHHLIALLGVVILIAALSQYSGRKGSAHEGADSNHQTAPEYLTAEERFAKESPAQQQQFYDAAAGASAQAVQPANPQGQNEQFASAGGVSTATSGLPPSCTQHKTTDPKELLPKDANNEFARLNPKGTNDLSQVNLLSAGHHAGINTVGGSLRNANLQVRSEPPNPTKAVSPWMQSTIEPDLMRVPLEIGCGPQ
jgi:hypothetical protein